MAYKQSLVAAVLIAMTAACGGRDPQIPADAQEMGLMPVGNSQQQQHWSGFTERARLAIRDQDAWASAWTTVMAQSASPVGPPQVDFESEMVVLAAMGQRNTGGYTIEIREAAANAEALYVSVVETSPGSGCGTTQALTQPVVMARVARYDGEVRFINNEVTRNCW